MRGRILSIGLLAFLFTAMLVVCRAKKDEGCYSSCGNISNISFPFGLEGDPRNCGYPEFQLSCENNRTVLHLHYSNKKLWVEAIDYKNKTIRVVDSSLQSNDCSSLPHNSMTSEDLTGGDPYILPSYRAIGDPDILPSYPTNTIFVNCSVQMDKDPASYIPTYHRLLKFHLWGIHLCPWAFDDAARAPSILQSCSQSPYNVGNGERRKV